MTDVIRAEVKMQKEPVCGVSSVYTDTNILRFGSEVYMVLADLQTIRGTTVNLCYFTNYKLFYKSEDYAPATECDVLTVLYTHC